MKIHGLACARCAGTCLLFVYDTNPERKHARGHAQSGEGVTIMKNARTTVPTYTVLSTGVAMK